MMKTPAPPPPPSPRPHHHHLLLVYHLSMHHLKQAPPIPLAQRKSLRGKKNK